MKDISIYKYDADNYEVIDSSSDKYELVNGTLDVILQYVRDMYGPTIFITYREKYNG